MALKLTKLARFHQMFLKIAFNFIFNCLSTIVCDCRIFNYLKVALALLIVYTGTL